MNSFKVKLWFPDSMLDIMGLVKLVILSGEDLDIYSWWIILSEKISVSGIMELLSDIATYAYRANILGLPYLLFPPY